MTDLAVRPFFFFFLNADGQMKFRRNLKVFLFLDLCKGLTIYLVEGEEQRRGSYVKLPFLFLSLPLLLLLLLDASLPSSQSTPSLNPFASPLIQAARASETHYRAIHNENLYLSIWHLLGHEDGSVRAKSCNLIGNLCRF